MAAAVRLGTTFSMLLGMTIAEEVMFDPIECLASYKRSRLRAVRMGSISLGDVVFYTRAEDPILYS